MNRTSFLSRTAICFVIVSLHAAPLTAKDGLKTEAQGSNSSELSSLIIEFLQKSYPQAKITKVARETENGAQVLDVETVDGNETRDFLFSMEGSLIEIGEHVSIAQLPAAVLSAIQKAYPTSTIVEAEVKTFSGTARYDITLKGVGRKHEVFLTPSGSMLSVQDDEEELDEGDDD